MVTLLYFIAFVMSLFVMCLLLLTNKKIDTLLVIVGVLVCINNMGRYMVAISDTLETAIWATKLMYVGGIYSPVMFIVLIAQLCNLKMPKWLQGLMMVSATAVLGFVMTIGYSPIYYSDVQLGYADGYNYLIRTYGPTHVLYPSFMALCAMVLVFYIIYAIHKRSSISARTVAILSFGGFALEVTYLVEKTLHSRISYISIGYLITVVIMGILFTRINMFDMSSNIANSVERLKEFGYIELDIKNRFINANQYIRELFPEINEKWKIDAAIPVSDSFLYREIIDWAISTQEKSTKTIKVNDLYFELRVNDLLYGSNKKIGRFIELIDRTDEKKYTYAIQEYNENLRREVELKTADILHIKDKMVLGLASMIESRDDSTGGHIKRTSGVVNIFANHLIGDARWNITKEYAEMISKAAPMHDLGKIAVDDSILRKHGDFTGNEYDEMKKHAEEGAKILETILRDAEDGKFVDIAKNMAHYHHEKWNGDGYPKGLTGMKIPLEARIMAIVDVFDALVSERCYKEGYSYDKAFAIITESLGTHFDPELGEKFLECEEELKTWYDGCRE